MLSDFRAQVGDWRAGKLVCTVCHSSLSPWRRAARLKEGKTTALICDDCLFKRSHGQYNRCGHCRSWFTGNGRISKATQECFYPPRLCNDCPEYFDCRVCYFWKPPSQRSGHDSRACIDCIPTPAALDDERTRKKKQLEQKERARQQYNELIQEYRRTHRGEQPYIDYAQARCSHFRQERFEKDYFIDHGRPSQSFRHVIDCAFCKKVFLKETMEQWHRRRRRWAFFRKERPGRVFRV